MAASLGINVVTSVFCTWPYTCLCVLPEDTIHQIWSEALSVWRLSIRLSVRPAPYLFFLYFCHLIRPVFTQMNRIIIFEQTV